MRSGPTVGLVAGLVSDHRVGDLVGAVRHRAADHTALLAFSVSPAGLGCEVSGRLLSEASFWRLPRRLIVRRCSSRSTSFVLAALRALQVDRDEQRRTLRQQETPKPEVTLTFTTTASR